MNGIFCFKKYLFSDLIETKSYPSIFFWKIKKKNLVFVQGREQSFWIGLKKIDESKYLIFQAFWCQFFFRSNSFCSVRKKQRKCFLFLACTNRFVEPRLKEGRKSNWRWISLTLKLIFLQKNRVKLFHPIFSRKLS